MLTFNKLLEWESPPTFIWRQFLGDVRASQDFDKLLGLEPVQELIRKEHDL
jgi:hypothetical protein